MSDLHPPQPYALSDAKRPAWLRREQAQTLPSDHRLREHHRRSGAHKRAWSFAAALLLGAACTTFMWNSWRGVRAFTPQAEVIPATSGTNKPAFIIKAHNGAVSTENQNCSRIGVDILRQGGNAVDAAIAATLCVGTVSMFASGIGGGGFATIRVPGKGVFTVNFRESAPAAANKTMFGQDRESSMVGGLSVGVPGELLGLHTMYRNWGGGGGLTWENVVTPTAELSKGWYIGPELGRRLDSCRESKECTNFLGAHPDWAPVFAPKGRILTEGDWISRVNLSRTLYTVAKQGVGPFYNGSIAESLVKKIRETGGIMTIEDFRDYTVQVQPALKSTYRNKTVYTSQAPSSGGVLLHVLNLLDKYEDIPKEGLTPLNVHRMVEALKFGMAAKTRVGDPDFISNMTLLDEIHTKEFADRIAPRIADNETHSYEYYEPMFDVVEDHGTMHLSVVDKDRMAVSITSTINLSFGSRVMDPSTGVILNDELDDFSRPGMRNAFGLAPSPFNYPGSRKRPLSSTCPTIIDNEDGTLHAVVGGSGGSKIYPAVAQVILGLDVGRDISAAIEAPRAHDQLIPPIVDLDSSFTADIASGMRARGHNVSVTDVNIIKAVVQGIMVDKDNVVWAAADSRKNGIAAGY